MTLNRSRPRAHAGPASRQNGRLTTIHYPESDGKPMGETEVHINELIRVFQTLRDRYADQPAVYVFANMMFYYEEGNPRTALSPDVAVAFGVPKLPPRRVFKVWEETTPATVFEITSRKTRREDQGKKREIYARIGVREYFLYDPLAEYMRPALQGFRLEDGAYRPIVPEADGALVSEALGLVLRLVDGRLRFFDRQTGELLVSPAERTAQADARAAAAEERAAAAEREAARLRALLAQRQSPA